MNNFETILSNCINGNWTSAKASYQDMDSVEAGQFFVYLHDQLSDLDKIISIVQVLTR